jgi:hypothetical protein
MDDEDFEPDSVDLAESKDWQALAPIFLEKFYGEDKGHLDSRYKENDLTPIVLTGPRDPDQFKLAQSALEKMNAARKARGWITFTLKNPNAVKAPVDVVEVTNETSEVAVK